ncbi:MAG: thioredoxin family protein [Alicyclobacillus sp.]|nr:thioredoxin family protein [Alicyclobacillus sp.]
MPQQITSEAQFQEAIARDTPTVVEFYTTWCPDCRRVSGFLDEIVARHTDKQFYGMNSEEFPEISDRYEVKGAPSFLIFRNGEKVAHLHSRWAKTEREIEEFLQTMESKTL